MTSPDDVPTTHCSRCGVSMLFDPASAGVEDGLCPRCRQTEIRWSTFALYTSTSVVALVLIGVLLHVLFPR